MTTAPSDLLTLRSGISKLTGVIDMTALGIIGDDHHGKGYHLGVESIMALGNYPNNDWSTRLMRDRVGGDTASAMDVTLSWPHGGRSAAIKWSNAVAESVRQGQLPYVSEINWMKPDGSKRRLTTYNMVEVASTDTVDIHTHIGFYRDTEGKRDFGPILALMNAAINGGSLTMADWTQQQINDVVYTLVSNPAGPLHARLTVLTNQLNQIAASVGAETTVDTDIQSVVHGIADALKNAPSVPVDTSNVDDVAKAVAHYFGVQLSREDQ